MKNFSQEQQVLEASAATKPDLTAGPRPADTGAIDGRAAKARKAVYDAPDFEPPQIKYVRQKRKAVQANPAVAFAELSAPPRRKAGAQELKTPLRKTPVHVSNRPPRFPPGAWPLEMRADTLAAFLDFSSTRELCKAIQRGEAPRPNATRGSGIAIEVVWFVKAVEDFVARRNLAKID